MSRFLNNKWSIIGLVVLAIYFVLDTAILPYVGNDITHTEVVDIPMITEENTSKIDIRASKKVAIHQLFWKDIPTRDPFSTKRFNLKSETKKVQAIRVATKKQTKHSNVKNVPVPQLTGFIAGKDSNLVVLNGQIVGVGQLINGYKIIDIDSKGVSLRRLTSTKIITLSLE